VKKRNNTEKPKWKEILSDIFELPEDIILNLPRLTLIGNRQLLLENHRGIIEYTGEKIRVGVRGGEIVIQGKQLQIFRLMVEEIYVGGIIEKVYFEE